MSVRTYFPQRPGIFPFNIKKSTNVWQFKNDLFVTWLYRLFSRTYKDWRFTFAGELQRVQFIAEWLTKYDSAINQLASGKTTKHHGQPLSTSTASKDSPRSATLCKMTFYERVLHFKQYICLIKTKTTYILVSPVRLYPESPSFHFLLICWQWMFEIMNKIWVWTMFFFSFLSGRYFSARYERRWLWPAQARHSVTKPHISHTLTTLSELPRRGVIPKKHQPAKKTVLATSKKNKCLAWECMRRRGSAPTILLIYGLTRFWDTNLIIIFFADRITNIEFKKKLYIRYDFSVLTSIIYCTPKCWLTFAVWGWRARIFFSFFC